MSVIAPVMSVVTCGEAMGLFASDKPSTLKDADRYIRVAAGAELNVATGLSRLGHRVGFVSRLGDDCLGHWLRDVMSRENIDHRFVIQDKLHSTGLMFKSRRSDGGDPDIEYHRKGSAASHLGIDDYPASYCTAARHLHITGISPAISLSARALIFHMVRDMRAAGRSVSFDPNLRAALWPSATVMRACLNELSGLADWVFPGLAEAQLLTGLDTVDDIVSFYIDKGCSLVAVKLGAAGAYYGTPTERGLCPGYLVSDVVDTVGAGDGFACGVISALLEGLSIAQAVDRGNLIGARVLGFPGDSDGLPTREQMLIFFQNAQKNDNYPSSPL